MRAACFAGLLLLAGCASAPRQPSVPNPESLAEADARLLQGCYDCLLEARDMYLRAGEGRMRPLVVHRLFEAELLIALREKELALDPSAAIDRATALLKELPPETEGARYLRLVQAIPPDRRGSARSALTAHMRLHASLAPTIDAEIAWLEDGRLQASVRRYLAISLDCAYGDRRPRARKPAEDAAEDEVTQTPPFLIYRAGLCADSPSLIEHVRRQVPAFVETAYPLGWKAVADMQRGGGAEARSLVAAAYDRFPRSPSVTMLAGLFQKLIGNCSEAQRRFDETIALVPGHEEAWLERTICYSTLEDTGAAIRSASHIIDRSMSTTRQAYYWRAFNHHVRGALADARADIDAAKRFGVFQDVLTLAGIIEYDQDDLETAERDLRTALRLARGRSCVAALYLGMTHAKREAWRESALHFETAMDCFLQTVALNEVELATTEQRSGLDPDYRASRIALLRASISDDRRRHYASALNAAYCFARAGDPEKSRPLLAIAAEDASLADDLARIIEYIR